MDEGNPNQKSESQEISFNQFIELVVEAASHPKSSPNQSQNDRKSEESQIESQSQSNHDSQMTEGYICFQCQPPIKFQKFHLYCMHVKKNHPKEKMILECSFCDETFSTVAARETHEKEHSEKPFQKQSEDLICYHCSPEREFKNRTSWKKHCSDYHPKNKASLRCSFCRKVFRSCPNKRYHEKAAHFKKWSARRNSRKNSKKKKEKRRENESSSNSDFDIWNDPNNSEEGSEEDESDDDEDNDNDYDDDGEKAKKEDLDKQIDLWIQGQEFHQENQEENRLEFEIVQWILARGKEMSENEDP